ncbi:MAG: hypothetical protein H7244_00470 [Herminiimonas sp.]|nr:hypothetical protein [Herminiimonas sp.]
MEAKSCCPLFADRMRWCIAAPACVEVEELVAGKRVTAPVGVVARTRDRPDPHAAMVVGNACLQAGIWKPKPLFERRLQSYLSNPFLITGKSIYLIRKSRKRKFLVTRCCAVVNSKSSIRSIDSF